MPRTRSYHLATTIAALSLGYLPLAAAQNSSVPANSAEAIDEVVVTGSRMRGVDAPVGSPVIDLDRDYIANSPAISVDQMIKELPQVFDLGISEASRGQSGGSGNIVWANSINLRGIGPYATLVLVDGHRVNSNARSIDPSVLPSLALERVEVMADGSSAVYGSDAVAGVVNLITRREVEGAEVIARRGAGDGYDDYKVGASWGGTWQAGSFFVAAEKGERDNLNGTDRDYFAAYQSPAADYRVARCAPGNIVVGGVSYAIPVDGVTPASADELQAGTANRCHGLADQDLLPRQEYENVAFTSTFELSDSFSMYLDGYWANRDFTRQSATSDAEFTVPETNAFYVDPTAAAASTRVQYRFNELPSNDQDGFQRNWQLTTGFKLDLPANWLLEGLVTYGDLHERSASVRGLNTGALNAALASSDPDMAFDPYGLYRTSPEVLAAISNQIFIADTYNESLVYELRADGALLELPGGSLRVALGAERQEMTNEPGLQRGIPPVPMNRPKYEREVDSYYGEVLIPIVGEGNAISGVQSLEFTVAARRDDYSDVGSTSNPKYGLNWSPVEDLRLRTSYGTSFRAPLFSQLYGNSSALFGQDYSDPTQGGAVVRGFALSGGNLDLKPEEATTWSLGFDYRPQAIPGLGLSLTWFDVEYEGQIETYLADMSILSLEDEFAGTGIILRGAEADAMVQSLVAQGFLVARGGPLPDPVELFVDGRTNNLGVSQTTGLDFAIDYLWSMNNYGDLVARLGGMYIDSYEVAITPTGTLEDRRNTIFNPLTFKSRSSLDWTLGNYSARLVWNHVNTYTNDRAQVPETISAFNTFDLRGSMILGDADGSGWLDGTLLSLDVLNVLDEEPPYARLAPGGNGGGGYDPTTSSPLGRVVGLSLRKSF